MRKLSIISLFLVMVSWCCYGQNNHIKALVSERVFLAPTETYYDKNDTVEVVGQLLSTDYGDFYPYSRYIYLELAGKKNELVLRQKVKCDQNGRFHATLPLEGNVENGVYYLRGYTQFMRNRNNAFYPMTPLYVGVRPAVPEDYSRLKAMFFPEGGHLVEGATQNVGLYICNGTNQPVQTRFWILKNATDTIASGKTTLSGLATFGFMPQSGVNYTLQTCKSKQSFLLPSLSPTPTIQAIIHKNRLVCNILPASQTSLESNHIYLPPQFRTKRNDC